MEVQVPNGTVDIAVEDEAEAGGGSQKVRVVLPGADRCLGV